MDYLNPSAERPAIIEQMRAELRGLPYRPAKRKTRPGSVRPSPEDAHSLFTVEKGNRWMELARRQPEAKMLFGELWHQGELCMMFADTNTGKSVLAVQIGESIASGQPIAPFTCQATPARVLYLDFELSQAQFGLRYSNGDQDHEFSENFFRAQYNFMADPPPGVDENELLIAAIEYKIRLTKATVLIIDNITCLRGGTENSAIALSLMKSLKALKTEHNLSILVLAHTPKRRNATQPISADDLHGSKLLINFADSAFAIGKSTAETELCYLKQIKQRNTRQRYGADNVCLCTIQKTAAFLHFKFDGHSPEHHHLLTRAAANRRQLANKINTLAANGLSQRDISRQLGIGLATVNRLIQCADVQMCGCADEERNVESPMTNDPKGCADMQMCGCADEEEFENLKMRKFEDEKGFANSPMTNDQKGCADMQMCGCADEERNVESPMTNDPKGCADMQMCGCADEEEFENLKMRKFEDEKGFANSPMTNDQKGCADMQMCGCADEERNVESPMTNDPKGCADMQMCGCADEERNVESLMTNDPMTNDQKTPMTNDLMTNDQTPGNTKSLTGERAVQRTPMEEGLASYAPANLTTSMIDNALSPALMARIKLTTMGENYAGEKGKNNFNQSTSAGLPAGLSVPLESFSPAGSSVPLEPISSVSVPLTSPTDL